MKEGIAQIVKRIAKLPDKKSKLEAFALQENNHVLKYILQLAYDPAIEWNLPEGTPPYKPFEGYDNEGLLYSEARRLYLFMKGMNSPLEPEHLKTRRENQWIQLLQSVTPDDAELLCMVKDKNITWRGMSEALVRDAFPGLLPERVRKEYTRKEEKQGVEEPEVAA
jgi:hypothetical protein